MKLTLHLIRLMLCISCTYGIATAQNTVKFSYLGQYNSQGVPDNLENNNDIIDANFLSSVNSALPEKKPVPEFNPQYIAQKNETDIILKAQADIYITFVHEGAGYTNALGYYTYPVSNPPKTASDIKNHTIIFPNVSYDNSGGGLKSGNKVYLQKFDANTAIGWFVVADAFKDGKLTQGKYVVYSEPSLNPEKDNSLKSHTVLLNDTKGNKILLGFEDVLRDQGSDQDFNDLIFYITASPFSAIKTDDVVTLPGNPTNTTTTNVPKDTINKQSSTNTNTNITNINLSTNVNNNNNGQNGTGTNTTTTNNNVNTGTNTNTNSNNTNTTTNTNTNTNSNNTTTIVNNTTIINNNGTNGTNSNNNNNNSNTNANPTNSTNTNTNSNTNNTATVASSVTVCNRDGLALTNFNNLKTTLKAQRVESNKASIIKQAVINKRVTVSQVGEIIKLITIEQYKMDMAKYLFDFTCDKSNYYQLSTLFLQSRVREFNTFLEGKEIVDDNVTTVNTTVTNSTNSNNTTTNVSNNSSVTNLKCDNGRMPYDDFDDIKENIQKQSFSSTQMSVLKEVMTIRCISASQVKSLLEVFSFEGDRLAMAKYLYSFTTDKQNYYKVNEAFSFSSSTEELNKFVKTGK